MPSSALVRRGSWNHRQSMLNERILSLMEWSRILTSPPKLNVLAGLVIALFKYASPHVGLFCFRVSV